MRSRKTNLPISLAPRDRSAERVLMPAGPTALTRRDLEARCLMRLARLLGRAAIRRAEDHGRRWKPGDFDIVIVETTLAPDAVLYVQLWSEPGQPTIWEVGSRSANPGAGRFVTTRVRRILRDMGFAADENAGSFRKQALIANSGDALSAARDVLRIFHDAFRYRGATPLVVRVFEYERSGRAVVHNRFTPEDIVNILRFRGYAAEVGMGRERQPLVLVDAGGFRFVVAPAIPSGDGCFHCLDVTTVVGHVEGETESAWLAALNKLNGRSRAARAWVDEDGDVLVGASVMCVRGVTEDYVAERIEAWHRSALELVNNRPGPARGGGLEDGGEGEQAGDVSDDSTAPRRKRQTEVVH
ncbi:MAG: YbjN domain-containing protein [Vicinamibacterales bacterium]